jgi:hypothetical protein
MLPTAEVISFTVAADCIWRCAAAALVEAARVP